MHNEVSESRRTPKEAVFLGIRFLSTGHYLCQHGCNEGILLHCGQHCITGTTNQAQSLLKLSNHSDERCHKKSTSNMESKHVCAGHREAWQVFSNQVCTRNKMWRLFGSCCTWSELWKQRRALLLRGEAICPVGLHLWPAGLAGLSLKLLEVPVKLCDQTDKL
jgi:hypothetical protein